MLAHLAAASLLFAACKPGSKAGEGITVVGENEGTGGSGGSGGTDVPPIGLTPEEQMLYEQPPAPGCGDFDRGDDEACDDGNNDNLDGCSANCLLVEPGYECIEPGTPCTLAEVCGDGVLVGLETCDDGNADPDDGCASNCRPEAGYTCTEPGEPCESIVICGDGFVVLDETCDDGNAVAGDGCSDSCQLENGYQCLLANAKCRPVCGDGQIIANERCDDGNDDPNDGCDENCRLEPNSVCGTPGDACEATECGDTDTPEGSEQCDDGNLLPYDGCTPECTNEPVCRNLAGDYVCAAVCGDGMKFPEEACDDGNTEADDGCSPTCEPELGYDCVDAAPVLGNTLALPVIIRDFSAGHPQFEVDPQGDQRLPGIVQAQLSDEGKPVYNPLFTFNGKPWTLDGPDEAGGQFANEAGTLSAAQIATRFAEWYTDVPGQNFTFLRTLNLALQGNGSFQFSATGAAGQFFPINAVGFGNEGNATNFHFTSEVRQWFQSQGGEILQFRGDDDVWVFVNGQLTVDLGGIHSEIQGSIELGAVGEPSELCVQNVPTNPAVTCTDVNVPISPNVNEIVVFQAERHVTLSNYTLSLRGFAAPVTSCQSVCGDGNLTPDETCDEGDLNGSGYERCTTSCVPGPRCGDANVDPEEDCDNGVNRDGYFLTEDSCAPGCVLPSACGDGVINPAFGEQCDDGVNDNSYGGCNSQCKLGPRCGDGNPDDDDEQCDDGNRRNGDGCNVNCALERDPA